GGLRGGGGSRRNLRRAGRGLHSGGGQGGRECGLSRGVREADDEERRRERQAAACQAGVEATTGQFQAALDRPCRAAELPCGLVAGTALQVTQDQRRAVALRELSQLIVESRQQFLCGHFLERIGGRSLVGPLLLAPPRRRARPALERDAVRDLIEPTRNRGTVGDRGGLAREDEEGGLKGVLGIVAVPQDAPADAEDERPVPAHQSLEGGLVAGVGETLQ